MGEGLCRYCNQEDDGDICTVCQEEMFVREQAIRALLTLHHETRCGTGCRCEEREAAYRSEATAPLRDAAACVTVTGP